MADRADQSGLDAQWAAAVAAGDFGAARAMLADLRDACGDVRGFALELDAARWLAGRPDARRPSAEDVRALSGHVPAAALARAAGLCVRAAVLAFDGRAAGDLDAVLRALAARSDAGVETVVRAEVARTWSSLLRGDYAGATSAAVEATRGARAGAIAAAVPELMAARALVALGEGDLSAATLAARRAVRMAQSEGAPVDELLANVVLARVRRASGAPYLATRILRALRDLASAPFFPWIEYELSLAGGHRARQQRAPASRTRAAADEPASSAAMAADALAVLAAALAEGDRGAIEAAAAALRDGTREIAAVHAEALDLIAAVGASGAAHASPAMAAWIAGETHELPHGMHAFGAADDDEAGSVVAHVVARPAERAFRVLAAGRPVGSAEDGGSTPRVIEPGRRPQERTDAAIALLALRREPMDAERFFQELYGFAYKPSLHASVLSTLLHRVRATLEGAATLHRDDDGLRLELHLPLVVWDPRCQRPLEDRILSVLTRGGPSTAKRAADRLGIPLRTVQAALGQLVEGGACKRDRQGRAVEYVVEDTTFSEPTVTRARAWREATRVPH